ncbi:MAG TPA: hypothetical protein VH722_19920 [Alphaproteobacteria bacterium]|jgi:hypothetical protein|nr:hypothetical protein [Alphaproteobacteria bacterium]
MRIASAFIALALSVPGLAEAQTTQNPVGRYEMVALPKQPGSYDNRVMILDTADGHLWQWWEAPAVGSSVPSTGITYLGKIAAGNAPGESMPVRRSGAPEPIVPHH